MSLLKYLIIHCTATPEGRNVSAETLKHWHTDPPPNGQGWHQVGYSDLILLDGNRHQFVKHNNDLIVDSFEITNGVLGYNDISRHVCYVGGMDQWYKNPKDTRSENQNKTLIDLIHEVLAYAPDIKIGGHNQFNNKACPSFFVPVWLEEIGIPEKNIERRDPFGYHLFFSK